MERTRGTLVYIMRLSPKRKELAWRKGLPLADCTKNKGKPGETGMEDMK